ncbi:MAG: hypothetical protein IJF20_03490 [Clostridia bacterium]|nr:hypothetical protein [Clostridia bacterium]
MHDTKNQKTADPKIDEIINRRMKNLFISLLATATIKQIEEDENGCYVKMSYEHDGEHYTNINLYKSDKGFVEGETKEIRILLTSPDVVYPQKTYIRDLGLRTGVLVAASCAFIYEIVRYVKNKKIRN